MDDSWTPAQTHAGHYWSVAECCWLPSPAPTVQLPEQRVDEPATETADA